MNTQLDHSKPRIAALCATPRFMNTGMRCVDQSLYELLASLNLLKNTNFYCFDPPSHQNTDEVEILYKAIYEMKPYSEYDLILLWGDFIVTKKWIDRVCEIMVGAGSSSQKSSVRNLVENRVLLSGCTHDIYEKTILYGQSIMVDDYSIFKDGRYFKQFATLLHEVKFARFRDPLSAYRAGMISGLPTGNFMGVDAALMLASLDKYERPKSGENKSNESIGVFFGRTRNAKLTKLLIGLVLRREYPRSKVRWIPWLRDREHPGDSLKKVFRLSVKSRPSSVEGFIQELQASRFIVTDTYHMSLLAWSYGIPSICIGNGLQIFTKTVDDKKKELFYSQNYLTDYYIYNESGVKDFFSGRMAKAFRLASETNIGEEIRVRLRSVAKENIKAIKHAIKDILE